MADDTFEMRTRIASLEEKNERLTKSLLGARERIEDMNEQLQALSRPPASYATFLSPRPVDHSIDALVGGRKMNLAASSLLDIAGLHPGQEVRLNEELVAVEAAGYEDTGQIAYLEMMVDSSHALVRLHADESRVMRVAGKLDHGSVRVGDTVLVDTRTGFVLDVVERPDVEHLLLEEVPNVSYEDIGGLSPQIEQIKDSVELPFQQPELYREHGLRPPKGVLLYGPPGCGKTLIAKAVATSLARSATRRDSRAPATSYFLNVKGPQLLDKYVGETERQIREIFSRARDRASRGIPVVIFFDEMEALFRTRGSGISSDVETTVVPQLLAEIDGVEALENVIVIGASNREDMIDPAILRPGRLDVKVRIERPNREGCLDIASKYLTADVPVHASELEGKSAEEAAAHLRRVLVDTLCERSEENEYVELTYANGAREKLYVADFLSGAMIAGIIDRAKRLAIKDLLATGERGVRADHIRAAVREETAENEELAAISNPEEWARVNGRPWGMRIASIRPLSAAGAGESAAESTWGDSVPEGRL